MPTTTSNNSLTYTNNNIYTTTQTPTETNIDSSVGLNTFLELLQKNDSNYIISTTKYTYSEKSRIIEYYLCYTGIDNNIKRIKIFTCLVLNNIDIQGQYSNLNINLLYIFTNKKNIYNIYQSINDKKVYIYARELEIKESINISSLFNKNISDPNLAIEKFINENIEKLKIKDYKKIINFKANNHIYIKEKDSNDNINDNIIAKFNDNNELIINNMFISNNIILEFYNVKNLIISNYFTLSQYTIIYANSNTNISTNNPIININYINDFTKKEEILNKEYINSIYRYALVNKSDINKLNTLAILNNLQKLEYSNIIIDTSVKNKTTNIYYLFIYNSITTSFNVSLYNYNITDNNFFEKTSIKINNIDYDCFKITVNDEFINNYIKILYNETCNEYIRIDINDDTYINILFNHKLLDYELLKDNEDNYNFNIYFNFLTLSKYYEKIYNCIKYKITREPYILLVLNNRYSYRFDFKDKLKDKKNITEKDIHNITMQFIKWIYDNMSYIDILYFEKNILAILDNLINNSYKNINNTQYNNYVLYTSHNIINNETNGEEFYNLEDTIELYDNNIYNYQEIDFINNKLYKPKISIKELFYQYIINYLDSNISDKELLLLFEKYYLENQLIKFIKINDNLNTYNIKYTLKLI